VRDRHRHGRSRPRSPHAPNTVNQALDEAFSGSNQLRRACCPARAPERISLAWLNPSLTRTTTGDFVSARPLARFDILNTITVRVETMMPLIEAYWRAIRTGGQQTTGDCCAVEERSPAPPDSPGLRASHVRACLRALALNC